MKRHNLHAHRFYALLDTSYVTAEAFPSTCRALIEGGADMIEFRAKDVNAETRIQLLDTIAPLCQQNNIPLIVNDHIDLALRHPHTGLHIGQDDMPVHEARKALGPERILGLSTHSLEQAKEAIRHADSLSYFAVGPIFATPTKPDYQPVGLELVAAVNGLQPELPFYAIGGITRQNVGQVIAAGARRVCVVSDILQAEDPAAATRELLTHIDEALGS